MVRKVKKVKEATVSDVCSQLCIRGTYTLHRADVLPAYRELVEDRRRIERARKLSKKVPLLGWLSRGVQGR